MRDERTNGPRFLELLRPLERDLERFARRLLWNPDDLPDALQNATLRAFAAFDRYHADASFRGWMFKILTREAFTLNRRHARLARHEFQLDPADLAALSVADDPVQPAAGFPDAARLDEQLEPAVQQALRTLTEHERAVLLLRALADLRYREIAETLEMPLGSVMGHLSRARQKMRAALPHPTAAATAAVAAKTLPP